MLKNVMVMVITFPVSFAPVPLTGKGKTSTGLIPKKDIVIVITRYCYCNNRIGYF